MKTKKTTQKMSYVFLLVMIIFTLVGCSGETVVIDEVKTPIDNENISQDVEIEDNQVVIEDINKDNIQEKEPELNIKDDEPVVTDKIEDIIATPEFENKHYREKLNPELHPLYDAIYDGLFFVKRKVSIPISNTQTISDVFEFVRMDSPQFFYCPSSFKILTTKIGGQVSAMEIEFEYNDLWNNENISNAQKEIDKVSKQILSELSAIDGDYNKVLYLYMYLTKNIQYKSDEENNYSIYGALVQKNATCEGFAESFQYLLTLSGIEAISVVGESKEQAHEWNMAKIDNQWYFFDVTWDSPTNTSKYLPYNYFALTNNDLLLSHNIYFSEYLPEANNVKYNYYYYNDLLLSGYSEKEVVEISKRSHELNPNHISFRTLDINTYDQVISNIQTWLPKALKEIGIVKNEISYMSNTELNIIDIVLEEE